MAKKLTVKEKLEKYAALKEKNYQSFFKKVISIEISKEYSSLQVAMRNKAIGIFNTLSNTNFFVTWEKIGQADLYKIQEITGGKIKPSDQQLTFKFS